MFAHIRKMKNRHTHTHTSREKQIEKDRERYGGDNGKVRQKQV